MKKQTLFTAIAALAFLLVTSSTFVAQDQKYKPGERVECEVTGNPNGKYWTKGTVQPFKNGDFPAGIEPDGSWYRVKADANGVEYFCKPDVLRSSAAAAVTDGTENKPETDTGKTPARAPDEKEPALNEGEFLECPVEQKKVKNGSRPDAELLKKIIRCAKGEKGVEEGEEGAVKVEVSGIQIGTSRPWSYDQDLGNAKPGTIVYPVKTTYTVKTLYRTVTAVEENSIRILNFYVNAFGEWQIGSEENIKSPKVRRIPK